MPSTDHRRRINDIRLGKDTPAARAWKRLNVLFQDAGMLNREDRLSLASVVLKKPVASTTDLTDSEVHDIVSSINTWRDIDKVRLNTGVGVLDAAITMKLADGDIDAFGGDAFIGKKARSLLPAKERKKFMAKAPKIGDKVSSTREDLVKEIMKLDGVTVKPHTEQEIPDENGNYSFGRLPLEQCIPSAVPIISVMLETGGLPKGSVIQSWGEPGCGKTMLALNEIAAQQKYGRPCFFLNLEHAYSSRLASQIGVKIEDLTVVDTDSLQSAGMVLKMLAGEDVFIVLDSVGSAVSKHETERDLSNSNAKLGGASAEWTNIINSFRTLQGDTTLMLINQVRANLNSGPYGNPNKPYGPVAIQHAIDVSLFCTKAKPKTPALANKGYSTMNFSFAKNRWSDTNGKKGSVTYKPGFAFSKTLNMLDTADVPLKFTDTPRGVWTDTIMPDHKVEGSGDEQKTVPSKGHFTFAFSNDKVREALQKDCENNGEDMPEGDRLSIYNKMPAVGWLSKHPLYMDAVEDVILDTVDQDYKNLMDSRGEYL